MQVEVEPASFRDPAGFIFRRDGQLYRQVNEPAREDYERLMSSGLYARLVEDGLLVAHEEAPLSVAAASGAFRVLRPHTVPFISYPSEWCFSQLKAAALLTLRVQRLAMEHGMSLKDATAYNVQFEGCAPVFIDTLSFEAYEEGQPWVAYRQFCEHFLGPLALMAYTDERLGQLLRIHVDGVPLDLVAAMLPLRARMRLSLAPHIFLHARSQRRHADAAPTRAPRLSRQGLLGLIDHLETVIRRLEPRGKDTTWGDYYEANHNYTDEAFARKRTIVTDMLAKADAQTVWDLGANAGVFSRAARELGCQVVSMDFDHAAIEASYRAAVERDDRMLLPLIVDLANPTPAMGWAHQERRSLAQRGPADAGLALALVHHLAIGNNLPFDHIASHFASLFEHLVIEFVPKEDSQVQRLLRTREDVFADYTREGFEKAFSHHFEVVDVAPVEGSHRVVYLMRSREATR